MKSHYVQIIWNMARRWTRKSKMPQKMCDLHVCKHINTILTKYNIPFCLSANVLEY